MLQKNQMKKRLKNKGILGITDFEKCRKMSKERMKNVENKGKMKTGNEKKSRKRMKNQ